MADPNERDAKLIQYMQEAYGKEQELELALAADILITPKGPYQKRLKAHLKETKGQAKALDRRIKKLGGGGHAVQTLIGKATAAAKAPLHAVRGSGEAEKMLKNAKTQYAAESEEISTYLALEVFATKVGDSETAKLAREIRREEERMASYLLGQIKGSASAVAREEIPASQRRVAKPRGATKKRTTKRRARGAPARGAGAGKRTAKGAAGKPGAAKGGTKKATKRSPKRTPVKTGAKKASKPK